MRNVRWPEFVARRPDMIWTKYNLVVPASTEADMEKSCEPFTVTNPLGADLHSIVVTAC